MTPLQWVTLSAYARSLPASEQRAQLKAALRHLAPSLKQQGTALYLAECAGLLQGGRLTMRGKLAAMTYYRRQARRLGLL